jgi:glutathione peroxidase
MGQTLAARCTARRVCEHRSMSLNEIPLETLSGEPASLRDFEGGPVLIVNVASKCGLTPQYEGFQRLQDEYGPRGLTVLGFPCNQFMGQEPGTPDEIREFCTANYAVTFPLFAKIDVNGPQRHPLYEQLTQATDAEGTAGDIQWNFEKFLVGRDGVVRERFRPRTDPFAPEVVTAVEAALA